MAEEIVTVNPYLFILLLRMLYYEFVGLQVKLPSDHEMAAIIIESLKDNKLWKSKNDIYIRAFATNIRKNMLPLKKSRFEKYRLDLIVVQITKLGKFDNWNDFVTKFKKDRGSIMAEAYMYDSLGNLLNTEKQKIIDWVDLKMNKLHKSFEINFGKNNYTVIKVNEKYIIRAISETELDSLANDKRFELFNRWVNFQDLKEMFKLNKNILFIYKNSYGVMAYICALPLKKFAYKEIVDGSLNFKKIRPYHIHSVKEKELVSFIYVQVFEQKQKNFLLYFAKYSNRIARTLSSVDEVVITAIDKTGIGRFLINKLKLNLVSKITETDIIYKSTIPLYEHVTYDRYEKVLDLRSPIL